MTDSLEDRIAAYFHDSCEVLARVASGSDTADPDDRYRQSVEQVLSSSDRRAIRRWRVFPCSVETEHLRVEGRAAGVTAERIVDSDKKVLLGKILRTAGRTACVESASVRAMSASLTPVAVTVAPRSQNRLAMAAPMSPAPPITTAWNPLASEKEGCVTLNLCYFRERGGGAVDSRTIRE